MLLGMAAAVLPLAIHLLSRGRSAPQPFSDLTFLQRVHQTRMRRIRLRQWLVLLLRTLAILLIAAAFARPAHQETGSGWIGSSVPTTAVMLLDHSFSTTYRDADGRLFERMKTQAQEVLDLFSESDQVVLIPFAGEPRDELGPTAINDLRQAVGDMLPSQEQTDVQRALSAVGRHFEPSATTNRELFVFTDLSRHSWNRDIVTDSLNTDRVYVLGPAPRFRPNVYLERLDTSSWMAAAGTKLRLHAVVANATGEPIHALGADLFVDGERVQRRHVDLPAGASVTIEFAFTPRRSGRLAGYVELEDDALALDNRRYFVVDVMSDIEVLILGGTSTDTYFPRRALTAAAAADRALRIDAGLFTDLTPQALESIDVLLLCNLRHLDTERTRLVREFVFGGGGLVIFPAPLADLSYLNRELLPSLLPAAIAEARIDRPQHLDPGGRHHVMFDGLFADDEADIPRFDSWFEIAAGDDVIPLVRFANGHVAFASGVANQGRAVLAAAPLVDDWNDLSIRGLFAPLMHRLTRYVSQGEGHRERYLIGDSVLRAVAGLSASTSVGAESPGGDRLLVSPETVGGRLAWMIPDVDESGIWKLRAEGQVVDQFPVNVDFRESDLSPVTRQRVLEVLGDRVYFVEAGDDVRNIVLGNRFGRELWRECLMLALLLLFLELWIARAPHSDHGPDADGNTLASDAGG